jgi:hypothetical protein
VVQKYIVTFGTKTDTILAKKSGNTLTTDSLADGTYTFGVVAVDVYGNLSPKAAKAVQVTHTDVKAQTFNSISFSPNPANDVIKFNNDITDKAIVYIYNITGQLELTSSVTNGTVNISSLKSGLYMIKLSNNNSTAIAKLVKR